MGACTRAVLSGDVAAKIRGQIKGGVFPVRLKAEEWQSGKINWLLDGEPATATGSRWRANAPDQKTTVQVIANFKQVVKDGELRMHTIVAKLVDAETLEKKGAPELQVRQ